MAQYRVLVTSFIDNHLRNEGDIVDIDDKVMEPGKNLEKVKGKRGSDSVADESAPAQAE